MIRIVADNYVKQEAREEFLKLAQQLINSTRMEEGNIMYNLHQDKNDENHLTFIEEWKDEDAIEKHNNSIHFTTLVPKMAACTSKIGTCYRYEIIM